MRGLVIVGAGPGGTGPLIWAARHDRLEALLASGVTLIDRSDTSGGSLGRYFVNSDSFGSSYLECLEGSAGSIFAPVRQDSCVSDVGNCEYPSLPLVGRLLERIVATLKDVVADHPGGEVVTGCEARALRLAPDGSVRVMVDHADLRELRARAVVLALGGRQDRPWNLKTELIPGVPLGRWDREDRIILSDDLLTREGLGRAAARLGGRNRRIVIIGGSHSAFAAAWALLNGPSGLEFDRGDITILHRRPPRVWYESAGTAQADRFAFSSRDICPLTGRVNRLSGLRGSGRALWRQVSGRSDTGVERRVKLVSFHTTTAVTRLLDGAALIVPALGYRPNTLPVFAASGARLPLRAERGGPAVDRHSRVVLGDGTSLRNVFSIGLASGFRPWGTMGGEPSFTGEQNSLWLYQNDVGKTVYDGVQTCLG